MYIGDLLFVTPTLRALRTTFPEAQLDVLVNRDAADMVRYNPLLDQVITVDKKGPEFRLLGFMGLLRKIRRARYDLVFILQSTERISILAALSGGRKIYGYAHPGFERFFTRTQPFLDDIPRADNHLQVLELHGVTVNRGQGLELWIDDASRRQAEARWQAAGLAGATVVGLNPGASWAEKAWPAERFAELADRLRARGFTPVIFGGAIDLPTTEQILAHTSAQPVVFTGQLTLLELAAMFERCAVVVSADSGPLHIAVARHVPVVGIYGPTTPVVFGPYRARAIVLESPECCLHHHDACRHWCINAITTDEVMQAVLTLLGESNQ
jgi:heptosyltransferase-2